jgi:hypothetical protein
VAGETGFNLSNRDGVGGLPPTAANKLIVGIAWPNGFGTRYCDGSLQRPQFFVLIKELVYLTRDSSLSRRGELEDFRRLREARPFAA